MCTTKTYAHTTYNPCYVRPTLCYVMLRYVTLCYVMLRYVMLCYVTCMLLCESLFCQLRQMTDRQISVLSSFSISVFSLSFSIFAPSPLLLHICSFSSPSPYMLFLHPFSISAPPPPPLLLFIFLLFSYSFS